MKQLKVALPDELRRRLDEAAERSGRSVADEVRTRLERTFTPDRVDGTTGELLMAIGQLVGMLRRQTGYNWHTHPDVWSALRAAIIARLERSRPTASTLAGVNLLRIAEHIGEGVPRNGDIQRMALVGISPQLADRIWKAHKGKDGPGFRTSRYVANPGDWSDSEARDAFTAAIAQPPDFLAQPQPEFPASPFVQSTDPEAIGVAVEAIAFKDSRSGRS